MLQLFLIYINVSGAKVLVSGPLSTLNNCWGPRRALCPVERELARAGCEISSNSGSWLLDIAIIKIKFYVNHISYIKAQAINTQNLALPNYSHLTILSMFLSR